jgi:hypothetical protein
MRVDGESLKVKFAGFTVSRSMVVSVNGPEVPVTVIVTAFAREEALLAVSVSTLAPVVGLGLNEAVTPYGSPDAVRFTLPVNPSCSVTVMFDVPEPPWGMVTVEGEVPRVKLASPVPPRAMLCVA